MPKKRKPPEITFQQHIADCPNRKAAVTFMLDHATIAYHLLSGDDHVADRDIVEVTLSGKFMAPFNIKSEH